MALAVDYARARERELAYRWMIYRVSRAVWSPVTRRSWCEVVELETWQAQRARLRREQGARSARYAAKKRRR